MPLLLAPAKRSDAGRIAEIHMAAFGSNAMLHAQFPTQAARTALQRSIELKAQADIDDPKVMVLVVHTAGSTTSCDRAGPGESQQDQHRQVIAFAKWSLPVAEDEEYTEHPWVWPEGTNLEVLEAWTRKEEKAHAKVMGKRPCYCMLRPLWPKMH